jgi:hypothetical protein
MRQPLSSIRVSRSSPRSPASPFPSRAHHHLRRKADRGVGPTDIEEIVALKVDFYGPKFELVVDSDGCFDQDRGSGRDGESSGCESRSNAFTLVLALCNADRHTVRVAEHSALGAAAAEGNAVYHFDVESLTDVDARFHSSTVKLANNLPGGIYEVRRRIYALILRAATRW